MAQLANRNWGCVTSVRSGLLVVSGERQLRNENNGKTQIKEPCTVTLHIYAPLRKGGFYSLDWLGQYTVPMLPMSALQPLLLNIPVEVMLELDLFAGQQYFQIFAEFEALRAVSLSTPASTDGGKASWASGSGAVARVMDMVKQDAKTLCAGTFGVTPTDCGFMFLPVEQLRAHRW
ncbi:hypothetical protein Micbo1qcDRAFT_180942 [Microdochium bolleyi]|uniref:Uncharacterized protein n=1 Tax=Microdochium bolleyi TaxID=196109 RepID=A0A136IJZ0_9PEZI|nr:hypothetical protein Micbo1qcDRAFT_180942 [Microdochium bolleyi]